MKKISILMAVALACATILSVAGCSEKTNVKDDQNDQDVVDISDEDTFFDALEKTAGISKDDMMVNEKNASFDGPDCEIVTFTEDGNNSYCYVRYEEAEDAMHAFRVRYDSLEELIETKEFDGSNRKMVNDKQGYLILDGSVDAGSAFGGMTFFEKDMHYYGVFYVNGNVYIEIYTLDGTENDKETIDAVLKEMNLPNM